MHIERLTKMVELLERPATSYSVRKFNLDTWFEPWIFDAEISFPYLETLNPDGDCGTIGLAALDPWFQAQGLSIGSNFDPEFEGDEGLNAVVQFFNLASLSDAEYVFEAISYSAESKTTRQQVADRIKSFIAEGGFQ